MLDYVKWRKKQIKSLRAKVAEQAAEIERLVACLKKANSQTEEFERKWYLTRDENEDLHTVMMAAAVEIDEHWAAHCDEEGYGPANLMHRLEQGIATKYGYDAKTIRHMEEHAQQLENCNAELRTEIERLHLDAEASQVDYTYNLTELTRQRDEAMQALKRIYYFQEDIGSPPMCSVSGLMQEIAKKAIDAVMSGSEK